MFKSHPMTDILENSLISHETLANGEYVFSLHMVYEGVRVAIFKYFSRNDIFQICYIDDRYAGLVLSLWDIALSWMKAYYIGYSAFDLEKLSQFQCAKA